MVMVANHRRDNQSCVVEEEPCYYSLGLGNSDAFQNSGALDLIKFRPNRWECPNLANQRRVMEDSSFNHHTGGGRTTVAKSDRRARVLEIEFSFELVDHLGLIELGVYDSSVSYTHLTLPTKA